jgi:hypothetical protein
MESVQAIASMPLGTMVLIGVFLLAIVFAMRVGFSQITAFTLALPFASVFFPLVTQTRWLEGIVANITSTSLGEQGLFLALTVLSYVFMRLIVRDGYGTSGKPVQGFMVALAAIIMLLVFRDQLPFVGSTAIPTILGPFTGIEYALWWMLISLGLLAAAWRTTDDF